jgi:uncharacterized protein (TIGR02246 family)
MPFPSSNMSALGGDRLNQGAALITRRAESNRGHYIKPAPSSIFDYERIEFMKEIEAAVTAVLARYQDALNASDTNAVMPLYAQDGVFMPQHGQSAVGTAVVRQAYDAVFQAIKLSVTFKIAEIVVMSPEWVFARTNSAGTVTVHATGATNAEGNQELFIFRKGSDGTWKIARYCFCTTNPPPK